MAKKVCFRVERIRKFELQANFPNPFNPETTISYLLPEQTDVQISIFNMLGQKVKTLVDTRQGPGSFTVKWDGRSDANLQLSSATYFYQIRSNGKTRTRRMLLLK